MTDGKGPFSVGDCVSVLAWRFDDDQEPERHGPSKEPSDPAKKPASGDEASPGS